LIRNKQRAVWEGYIANMESVFSPGGDGVNIDCIGGWGHILMNWQLNKPWADTRIDSNTWVMQTTGVETEEWTIERQNRIHITPNAGAFASGEYIAVRYTAPVGQTIKRMTYAYDFAEKAGQSWEMSVWRTNDPAGVWVQMDINAVSGDTYTTGTTTIITAAAANNIDVALGVASRYLELRFYSRANNNPVRDDHNHGIWSSLTVYSETGLINQEEIVKDIVGICTDLNTATNFIGAAGTALSLIPYITNGYMTLAEIVNEVAGVETSEITREKSFVDDLDIDSLSMVEIAVQVEDRFGVKVPDDELANLRTVGDAVDYVVKTA